MYPVETEGFFRGGGDDPVLRPGLPHPAECYGCGLEPETEGQLCSNDQCDLYESELA